MADLLPCPFCGDDGEKGIQAVTMMNAERTQFNRVTCRCCGAMCPEMNWNRRASSSLQPLTDQQIEGLAAEVWAIAQGKYGSISAAVDRIADSIRAAHGIVKQADTGSQT